MIYASTFTRPCDLTWGYVYVSSVCKFPLQEEGIQEPLVHIAPLALSFT